MYDNNEENDKYSKYNYLLRKQPKNNRKIEGDEKLKQNNEQLKIELDEFKNKFKKEKEENQTLNLKIKQLENDKLYMQRSLKEKDNEINHVKKELDELEKEREENQTLNFKIKQLENDKLKMQRLFEEKENEINNIKRERIEKKNKLLINNQNQELLNQINQYKESEKSYQKEIEKSSQKIQQLNDEIENMKKDAKYNSTEKENLSKDPLEFYNIIGDINSMQNVNTVGWDFYMNEEGYNIIQSKEKTERLVIGVMGNRNKGKSFILQALSGASLQTGTTINTIGISIKYLENKYVLLDCAGSESPLLGENTNMLEISRDKLFTEAFLESYILRKSNVLLLVVGILSFSEQKLINKISKDLEKLREIESKHLIVIHNLQTYDEVADVEKYIEQTLLKSASFKLKKDETNFSNEKEEAEFFYDIDNTLVKHFIYAKENSPAGYKYNKSTINAIKSLYKISTNKYVYDYKETIIEHFNYMAEKMYDGNLEGELKDNKGNERPKEEVKDNEIINANDNNKAIKNNNNCNNGNKEFNLIDKKFIKYILKMKYEGKEKLSLQKMVIDELGILSFIKNDFILNHEMYYNDQELIISIESPEGTQLSVKRKRNKKSQDYPYCIEVTAEKKEEPKKENVTYIKTKQYGKFNTLIPFSNVNYSIGKAEVDEKSITGWKTFKFPLAKVEDDE